MRIHVEASLQRIRVFLNLLRKSGLTGKRVGLRLAWRIAGVATGQVVPMPDSVIEWWWKVQDLLPQNSVPPSAAPPADPAPAAQVAAKRAGKSNAG
jgi:hypothetical protein